MRPGRAPEPGRADEVGGDGAFAKAHDWGLGSRFSAVWNGRKQGLVIVGTAYSPDFIYAIGPGAFMPDDRRFGVIWMSEKALANVYNLDGLFSSVTLKLLRGASEPEAIKAPRHFARSLRRPGSLRPERSAVARMDGTWSRHAQEHQPYVASNLSADRGVPHQPMAQSACRARTRTDRASEGAGVFPNIG